MASKVYLITGANRGIGRALTACYVSRDNTTVIAAVRDTTKDTSKSLTSLPAGKNSKVLLVKIDSLSEEDPKNAMESVVGKSIDHIDVIIANAGDSIFGQATTVSVEMLNYHHNLNTIGPILLFQVFWSLLQKSAEPKFVVISSTLGSLVEGPKYGMPTAAYGASKAAINYWLKLLHNENSTLIALPICPGWVQTDLGNYGAKQVGMKEAPVPLEISIKGVVKEIDEAVRTEDVRFASYDHIDKQW